MRFFVPKKFKLSELVRCRIFSDISPIGLVNLIQPVPANTVWISIDTLFKQKNKTAYTCQKKIPYSVLFDSMTKMNSGDNVLEQMARNEQIYQKIRGVIQSSTTDYKQKMHAVIVLAALQNTDIDLPKIELPDKLMQHLKLSAFSVLLNIKQLEIITETFLIDLSSTIHEVCIKALQNLTGLIPYLSPEEQLKLFQPFKKTLSDNKNKTVSIEALRSLVGLLPYLKPEIYEGLIESTKNAMNDSDVNAQTVALQMLAELIVHYESSLRKEWFILIKNTFHDNPQLQPALLSVLINLIPYLKSEEKEALIEPLKSILKQKNQILCDTALNTMAVLISQLESGLREQMSVAIDSALHSGDENVHREELLTLTILFPYLKQKTQANLLELIQKILEEKNWIIRHEHLKALKLLIPSLSLEQQKGLFELLKKQIRDECWLIRKEGLHVMAKLIPSLSTAQCSELAELSKSALGNKNESIRLEALNVLIVLIPTLKLTQQDELSTLVKNALGDKKAEVRQAALNAFTVLIPYLKPEKLAAYFKGVKEALNDQSEYIRCDALQILSILIPNLTSKQKEMLIEPINNALLSENVTVRKNALQTLAVLILFLDLENQQIFLELIQKILQNDNVSVRQEVLKTLTVTIPYLHPKICHKLFYSIQNALNDVDVCYTAFNTLAVLAPYLGQELKEEFIQLTQKNIRFSEKEPNFYAAQVILGKLSDYWSTAIAAYEEKCHFNSELKLIGL